MSSLRSHCLHWGLGMGSVSRHPPPSLSLVAPVSPFLPRLRDVVGRSAILLLPPLSLPAPPLVLATVPCLPSPPGGASPHPPWSRLPPHIDVGFCRPSALLPCSV